MWQHCKKHAVNFLHFCHFCNAEAQQTPPKVVDDRGILGRLGDAIGEHLFSGER